MVKEIKKIRSIIKSDFAGWLVNSKIYIVLLMLIIFTKHNCDPIFLFAKEYGYRVTPYLLPFLFSHPYMHLVIFSCIIFLFADAPFMNSLQMLIMTRSGRKCWYRSQMLYIFICSIIITVLLCILPMIFNINLIFLGNGWGKVISTLPNYTDIIHPVDYYVVSRFSPSVAMPYTILMVFLICFFIGMLVYTCNVVFKSRIIGILISAFLVILDWLIYLMDSYVLRWFSPLSWVQISKLAYAREHSIPSFSYVIPMMIALNIVLIGIVELTSRKRDITLSVN